MGYLRYLRDRYSDARNKARAVLLRDLDRIANEKPPVEHMAICRCCGASLISLERFTREDRICAKCDTIEKKNKNILDNVYDFLSDKLKYDPQLNSIRVDGVWIDEVDLILNDRRKKYAHYFTAYSMLLNNKIVIQEITRSGINEKVYTIDEFVDTAKYMGVDTRNFVRNFTEYC